MTRTSLRKFTGPAPALLMTALLGGCVSLSGDGGMSPVQTLARAELGKDAPIIATEAQAGAARTRVTALLKKPLTADAAVQIALLNNRGLQAAYNDLGISEAQYVQASLPPNPRVSLSRIGGSLDLEIERQIAANLLALMTLPARAEIAADRFKAAQLKAMEELLKVAAQARQQYIRAVAANEQAGTLAQVRETAGTSSELFRKLGETGAANKLSQAREHAFYAELSAQLAQARLTQRMEREKLVRVLGLWGDELKFTLPSRLPALPRLRTLRDVEAAALRQRVDLEMMRVELAALAKSLGLTNATRLTSDLELAGISNTEISKQVTVAADGTLALEKDKVNKRGLEIAFEIPLFDFGQARVAEAEQRYMKAANLLAQKAVEVRSQARGAYQAYRATRDIAALYTRDVLPLRQVIQEEAQLQYNGMLIDVTQLVADARARILSNRAAIDARRDFWLADAELTHALIGGASGSEPTATTSSMADAGSAGESH